MTFVRFPVEEGHVLAFARSIDETPPRVGEIVPPTFTACSTQQDPRHMRGLQPVGVLAAAAEAGGDVLQAEQHFEYLQPVRVGDVLTVTESPGRSWTKAGRNGEALQFFEVLREYSNPIGDVVVRSLTTLVRVGTDEGESAG
ncbi:hypothetical protein GCM10009547_13210 [Sporichthya brevicatena]|uniref:FAS1-like dehydratase domain-containing protein n=1 Tax=Sporichthya brevicatena TaxID=171442 RepID=A0ABN1GJN7_9ACTN